MCNCWSYNGQEGETPLVILEIPESFGFTKKIAGIDACIAHVIKHLWDNNVITHGSCCMHNESSPITGRCQPNVIIDDNATQEDVKKIEALIKKIDNREWEILQATDHGIEFCKGGVRKVN